MSTARRCPLVLPVLVLAALAAGCTAENKPQTAPEAVVRPVGGTPIQPIIRPVCGGLAQACCQPGNTCSGPNLTCIGGTCGGVVTAPCGHAGEGCCSTNPRCQSPLVCNANSICRQACGGVGQSCCRDGSPPCGNGLTCSASGSCVVTCGGNGQPCCTSGNPCGTFLGCFSGTCRPCGDIGQTCCPGLPGDQCAPQLVCNPSQICAGCGNKGQPCCSGNFCNLPATCTNGTCN